MGNYTVKAHQRELATEQEEERFVKIHSDALTELYIQKYGPITDDGTRLFIEQVSCMCAQNRMIVRQDVESLWLDSVACLRSRFTSGEAFLEFVLIKNIVVKEMICDPTRYTEVDDVVSRLTPASTDQDIKALLVGDSAMCVMSSHTETTPHNGVLRCTECYRLRGASWL